MLPKKIKQLEEAKALVAELELAIADEMAAELAELHIRYGFDDVEAFVVAVREAAGGSGGRRGRRAARRGPRARKASAAGAGAGRGRKRRRAVITDATRAEVKRLAREGKTGKEIAAALRISVPSVQNIKRDLGLVKARGGAKARKAAGRPAKAPSSKRSGRKRRAGRKPAARKESPAPEGATAAPTA